MWDIAKSFRAQHDGASPHYTEYSVIRPYWAHRIRDRRESRITVSGSPIYGGMTVAEAERIHAALGEAIALAKTLKLERPEKKISP